MKNVLPNLMTMEYVRVRKANIKELNELIERRRTTDWHVVAAVVGAIIVVAVTGLVLAL